MLKKSFLIILALVLFSGISSATPKKPVIKPLPTFKPERFIFVAGTKDCSVYLDTQTIKQVKNNDSEDTIFAVWFKYIYTKEAAIDMALANGNEKLKSLSYTMALNYLDNHGKSCTVKEFLYSTTGDILESTDLSTNLIWSDSIPESVGEGMYNKTMDYIKKHIKQIPVEIQTPKETPQPNSLEDNSL